jgi:hypothetical protein
MLATKNYVCDTCGHRRTEDEIKAWPLVLIGDGRQGIACLECSQGQFGIAWNQPAASRVALEQASQP